MCHYAAAFLSVVVIKNPYCEVAVIDGGDITVLPVFAGVSRNRSVDLYYGVFICQTAFAELVGDSMEDASYRCSVTKFHAEIDAIAEIGVLIDF